MTIKELKEMINLMQEHGLTELEIEKNGFKIRLKKGSSGAIVKEEIPVQMQAVSMERAQPSAVPVKEVDDESITIVRSPMVGTFYAAPAPDAEPYAVKGKDIQVGEVLCIIEAMKLMNEIKSEVKGKIVEILVENGQAVEFDQALFKIQKIKA
jgi:acetyl-CoA carboxylase biotin carboxyl carrier protein